MPEVVEITVYSFGELDDDTKAAVRDWYRKGGMDYDWWDAVYGEFEEVCALLGIDLATHVVRLLGGGARQKPCIYFRGFWSQGDGACFEGRYSYRTGATKAIRAYSPDDQNLHRIVDGLVDIQRRNFYQVRADCRHRGRYCHEQAMSVDVDRKEGSVSTNDEAGISDYLRDLARWLYMRLEAEYEHLTSDEAVDEAIDIGAYRFTQDGTITN